MRTPKENKQKPRDRTLKSAAGTIPKAALKAAWIKTKEQTRTAARENDTDPRQQEPTDLAGLAAEQSAAFVWHQGRKLAETQARQHRAKETAARAHAADERGVSPKQAECGTLPDAAQRPHRGADLPRQRAKEKAITAKTAPRDIRGVTQSQRQLRTAANETVRSVTPQAQMQTRAQKIRLAAQKAAGGTGRTAVAVRSAIRNFLADLHSFTAILAAGAGAALGIVIVISLVAFVSGSAYGIFFAADAPNAASLDRRAADALIDVAAGECPVRIFGDVALKIAFLVAETVDLLVFVGRNAGVVRHSKLGIENAAALRLHFVQSADVHRGASLLQAGAPGADDRTAVQLGQLVRLHMADKVVLVAGDAAAFEHFVIERKNLINLRTLEAVGHGNSSFC